MSKQRVSAKRKAQPGAQISVRPKHKQGGKGKPFEPGNPWRFIPGKSGNAGGRPKLLSDAYREWLAAEDKHGITNAAHITLAVGDKALGGDAQAVREIRQATEGERIRAWQDDVIDLLRAGKVSVEDVVRELGDEQAAPIVAAAGIRRDEGGEAQGGGRAAASTADNA